MKYLNTIYIIATLLVCATGCGPGSAVDLIGIENQIKEEENKLVPGTACQGENDKKHMFGTNITFARNVEKCVETDVGNMTANLNKDKMKRYYPEMTDGCIDCFVRLTSCSARKCAGACGPWPIGYGSDSQECDACNKAKCHLAMFECSGIPSADIPSLFQK